MIANCISNRCLLHILNPSLAEHDMPFLSKQCRSRSVGFWKSQLIWICTVCHYAPNFEEVGGAYCFWDVCACVHASIRPSVRPSVTLFDAEHNFWTMHARVLKFHIWILHEKIADLYFFSHQDYAPFLSYGPLKKYRWNLVSKISQKLLKLEPWNLVNRLVLMSRWPG